VHFIYGTRCVIFVTGDAKSPNGFVTRTSPRPQSSAHRTNGSVISPTGSYAGKSWCVTGGTGGSCSPPRSAGSASHSRSAASPRLASPVRPTTATGACRREPEASSPRSRLRLFGSKSDAASERDDGDITSPLLSPVQHRYNVDASSVDASSKIVNGSVTRVSIKQSTTLGSSHQNDASVVSNDSSGSIRHGDGADSHLTSTVVDVHDVNNVNSNDSLPGVDASSPDALDKSESRLAADDAAAAAPPTELLEQNGHSEAPLAQPVVEAGALKVSSKRRFLS
jgi:hypothetical protein